jgi:uncharacterized protein (TIGR02145 family)
VAESSSSYYKENWKYLNQDLEYGELIDERDGQIYKTIEIGGITWMAENLNYSDSNATENLKGQSWCYDNDPSNCAMYGRLYTWYAAMDVLSKDEVLSDTINHQGICPDKWHLPRNQDFSSLQQYSVSSLKSSGTNQTGFSILFAGYYLPTGVGFLYLGQVEQYWSSVDHQKYYSQAYCFPIASNNPGVGLWEKSYAISVRCIKD